MALATTMLFTSFNVVYAQDADSATGETTVEQSQETPADTTVSGDSVDVAGSTDEVSDQKFGIVQGETWPTTDPWKATVFGSIGTQARIDNYGDTSSTLYKKGPDGTVTMPYLVKENGDGSVNVRMGVPNPNDPTKPYDSQGKISSSEDGIVFYYQQLQADANFEISATAHINAIASNNNQVSFGAMIRDKVFINDGNTTDSTELGDYVAAGPLDMKKTFDPTLAGNMSFAFARAAGALEYQTSSLTVVPQIGQDYPVSIKKIGTSYKVTFGEESATIDGSHLAITDDIFAGFYASRSADITYSNIEVKDVSDEKIAESITVNTMPSQTEYYVGENFNRTGLSYTVKYNDGSSEVIEDGKDVSLSGFDSTANGQNIFSSVGEKEITVVYGPVKTTFKVNVRGKKVTKLELKYLPVRTEFLVDTTFDSNGLAPVATFEDGTTKDLTTDAYKLYLNGTELPQGTEIKSNLIGTQTISVMYTDTDSTIDPNGVAAAYDITVKNAKLDQMYVTVAANKVNFVQGEEFDSAGLIIEGKYTLDDGTVVRRMVDSSLYTFSGFDTTKTGTQKITITYKNDPTITTSYDVLVTTVKLVYAEINKYPLLTYMVGDTFKPDGLIVDVLYNTNQTQVIGSSDLYYLYDGKSYYTSKGDQVDEATAKAADYYIDLSQFSTASEGTGKVVVKISALGLNQNIELTTTTIAKKDYIWKATLFGASSMGVSGNPNSKSSEIILTDNEGNQTKNSSEVKQIASQTMTNGKLDNVSSVRLNSWTQAGKQSGDQDGIAYFYTIIDAKQNFKMSADVTVNRYIKDPDDPADDAAIRAKMSEVDENLIKDVPEDQKEEARYKLAIDMLRSGQEAFGIEARDVIPFAGGLDEDGNYTGGLGNHMTTSPELALKDAQGQPMNIYEAYKDGTVVTDKNGKEYRVTYSDVENTFASNIVVAGATTDSTWPASPTGTSDSGSSSSYYKKTQMNRINILIRTGVVATDGGGSRVGIKDTTDTLPLKGDKYNITLQKINEGYMITTYNYQTGETRSEYNSLNNLNINTLLDTQDDSYMTVGLYACRWADATFENVEFHEIDPQTDQTTIPADEKEYSPQITIISSNYSTTTDYQLSFKANNPNGGKIDISLNGNVIYQDAAVSKKTTIYNTTLVPDSVNEFTIVYKPSTADNCVSFDPVVTRFNVTQKSNIQNYKEMFVSPDGTASGDGTRANPLDLESAIGMSEFGTTIIMLDGTYHVKNTEKGKIAIGQALSGKADGRKALKADEGASPILDLEGKYEGFEVAASYWTFDGLTVRNAKGNGKAFVLGGHYDVVKNCTFHDNGELGFQIGRLVSTEVSVADWPSDNLVLNCESFNNNDPSKNNADGFAAKLTTGYNNVFSGCVSHHNLDDGWDCYTKLATGVIGAESLENCVAYKNGYSLNDDGTETDWGNGAGCNGFKMGGENIHVAHFLKDCITFENKRSGIDSNYNPGFKMRNIITYNNDGPNIKLYSGTGNIMKDENGSQTNSEGKPYKFDYDMKGVVSCAAPAKGSTTFDIIGSVWTEEGKEDTVYANLSKTPIVSESNYISYQPGTQGVNSLGETVNPETFFKSIDKEAVLGDDLRYERNADGSFKLGDFLARTDAYVHDAGDEVVYPDVEEKTSATTASTESTTAVTETTTKKTETTTKSSSNGGGGGSSGTIVNGATGLVKATTTTTEATTEAVSEEGTDEATEVTTNNAAFTVNPPASTGNKVTFKDVPATHWANDAVSALAEAGIANGVSADTFGVGSNSKRGDFVVMLIRALGIENSASANFSDVDSSKYYAKAIATAKAYGIVKGYEDNTFKPEAYITRQDMMVMVANALTAMGVDLDTDTTCLEKFSDTTGIATYARTSVAALVNAGIVKGSNGMISPVKNITRAEMAQLVKGVYDEAVAMAE